MFRHLKSHRRRCDLTKSTPDLSLSVKENPLSSSSSVAGNRNGFNTGPGLTTSSGANIDEFDRMSSVEGTLNLDIVLPGGKQIRMDVDASTPMMDLLVQVTSKNGITPGGLVLQVPTDRPPGYVSYKPSTPVGKLNTQVINVVPKSQMVDVAHKSKPKSANLPFEPTSRVQVDLPRGQKTTVRVSQNITLGTLLEKICQEQNLNYNNYLIRAADLPSIPLDCELKLTQTGTSRFVLISNTTADFRHSTDDILSLMSKMPFEEKQHNKRKGIFGLFHRNKNKQAKTKEQQQRTQQEDDGSTTTVSEKRSPLVPTQSQSPTQIESGIEVEAQQQKGSKKKRQAPKPPPMETSFDEPEPIAQSTVDVESQSTPVSPDDVDHEQTRIPTTLAESESPALSAVVVETKTVHIREQSDDSSGFHEPSSTTSHSPCSGSSVTHSVTSSGTSSLEKRSSKSALPVIGERKARAPPPPSGPSKPSDVSSNQKIVQSDRDLTAINPNVVMNQSGKEPKEWQEATATSCEQIDSEFAFVKSAESAENEITVVVRSVASTQEEDTSCWLSVAEALHSPGQDQNEPQQSDDLYIAEALGTEIGYESERLTEKPTDLDQMATEKEERGAHSDQIAIEQIEMPVDLDKIPKEQEDKEIDNQITSEQDENPTDSDQMVIEPQIKQLVDFDEISTEEKVVDSDIIGTDKTEQVHQLTFTSVVTVNIPSVVEPEPVVTASLPSPEIHSENKGEQNSQCESTVNEQSLYEAKKLDSEIGSTGGRNTPERQSNIVLKDPNRDKYPTMRVMSFEEEYYQSQTEDDYLSSIRYGIDNEPERYEDRYEREKDQKNERLNEEYNKLQRMFDDWQQLVNDHEALNERGQRLPTYKVRQLQNLQEMLVEQHKLVQTLCLNASTSLNAAKFDLKPVPFQNGRPGSAMSHQSSSISSLSTPTSRTSSPTKESAPSDKDEGEDKFFVRETADVLKMSKQPSGVLSSTALPIEKNVQQTSGGGTLITLRAKNVDETRTDNSAKRVVSHVDYSSSLVRPSSIKSHQRPVSVHYDTNRKSVSNNVSSQSKTYEDNSKKVRDVFKRQSTFDEDLVDTSGVVKPSQLFGTRKSSEKASVSVVPARVITNGIDYSKSLPQPLSPTKAPSTFASRVSAGTNRFPEQKTVNRDESKLPTTSYPKPYQTNVTPIVSATKSSSGTSRVKKEEPAMVKNVEIKSSNKGTVSPAEPVPKVSDVPVAPLVVPSAPPPPPPPPSIKEILPLQNGKEKHSLKRLPVETQSPTVTSSIAALQTKETTKASVTPSYSAKKVPVSKVAKEKNGLQKTSNGSPPPAPPMNAAELVSQMQTVKLKPHTERQMKTKTPPPASADSRSDLMSSIVNFGGSKGLKKVIFGAKTT